MDLVLPRSLYKAGWILLSRRTIIHIGLEFLVVFMIEKLFNLKVPTKHLLKNKFRQSNVGDGGFVN